MRSILVLGFGCLALSLAGPASAEVKMSGTFVADATCPATRTIRKAGNPGNIETKAGQGYALLAGNKDQPTHYMILVPGARPDLRWVEVRCGHVSGGAASPRAAGEPRPAATSGKPEYVLALSWQPAFCETRPGKTECRSQTANRYDATHFTLHGLWPQPNGNFYCNVSRDDRRDDKSGHWRELPAVRLDPDTRAELDRVMPGTASQLERHEWTKHGTCSGKSPQAYFSGALAMMRAVNGSAVRDLFASHIGKELTVEQIRAAFDNAFGAGAGDRVRLSCFRDRDNGQRMIGEVTLGLAGPIGPESSLRNLMAASAPTQDTGCPRGIVDAVGTR